MARKLSSSFTEFYKVFGIVVQIVFLILFWVYFFDSRDPIFPWFILLISVVNLLTAFDFWRMKEVELTDAGFLITERFFFKQKTAFVPFEKVDVVKSKFWWLGNFKRISIKFTENTEFGNEIAFLSNKLLKVSQGEMVEELNRIVRRSKANDQLKAAFQQPDN